MNLIILWWTGSMFPILISLSCQIPLSPNPAVSGLWSGSHHGLPGGRTHLLRVLLPVLWSTRATLLAHLLQELPGLSAPGLGQLLHLAAPPSAPQVPQLSQCGGADPVRHRRPAYQRVPARHRWKSRTTVRSIVGVNSLSLSTDHPLASLSVPER